jgi:hypothetical protein
MKTTPKTLVLKTVTVGGVKLPTPADRIGLGLVDVVTSSPAEVLSQGQFPLPPYPGSEPNPGARQVPSAEPMREHRRAGATVAPPAGPAGRPVPGSSAHRRPWSFTHHPATGWRLTAKRSAAAGRAATATGITPEATAILSAAVQSRASFPAVPSHSTWSGCDCQSPDRGYDARPATPEATPAAAAGK